MGKVGFGALKLKLMTSIIAIAAIHMLEDFMHVAEIDNRELGWVSASSSPSSSPACCSP
jgi:uncharacterized membrane protein YqhA